VNAPLVRRVEPAAPDPAVIAEAAGRLRAGGLVAFPTETVYGLGASALDADAVGRVFAAKGRPPTNPVIVHVPGAAEARLVAARWPAGAEALARRFWPGPLTLVLPRGAQVPLAVTAGLEQVAVRAPRHPVALALLRAAGLPVAAPSANRSTRLSPTTAAHVVAALGDRVDLVLDGGPTDVGIESTVLDLTGDVPRILRPGVVTATEIAAVLGVPVGVATGAVADDAARASPGMMALHYAPRARVVLAAGGEVPGAVARLRAAGHRVGALVHRADPGEAALARRLPADPAGYARALYAALHDLDAACDAIVVEEVPDGEAWAGVRDRLARAGSR